MKPVVISLIVFACVLGGSLLGMAYRSLLTERHLSGESRDFVLTIGLELAGVIAAFVLALGVTGAQSTFHDQRNELMRESAKIVFLNQILDDYGPETKDARDILRRTIANTIDEFWHSGGASPSEKGLDLNNVQTLYEKILSLNPRNDSQRSLREKALDISFDLEQSRDLLVIQQTRHIPKTFLIVLVLLVFWFIFIFFGLGIYAPLNSTAILMLALCALSVAIAFFMIIDLNLPFEGILRMPEAPLMDALHYIGR